MNFADGSSRQDTEVADWRSPQIRGCEISPQKGQNFSPNVLLCNGLLEFQERQTNCVLRELQACKKLVTNLGPLVDPKTAVQPG